MRTWIFTEVIAVNLEAGRRGRGQGGGVEKTRKGTLLKTKGTWWSRGCSPLQIKMS